MHVAEAFGVEGLGGEELSLGGQGGVFIVVACSRHR
jgi:hypothetical protein